MLQPKQVTEADWLTRPCKSKCAEVSVTQLLSYVLVTLNISSAGLRPSEVLSNVKFKRPQKFKVKILF
jgi:hypothetical protein